MIKRKGERRPQNLFFVELIMALLFFALSSAVILQVFAAAHTRQQQSTLTERAVICGQSIAEAYSVSGETELAMFAVFGERLGGETFALDDELKLAANGEVTLSLTEERVISAAGTLKWLNVSFSTEDGQLYAQRSAAYFPNVGGADDG